MNSSSFRHYYDYHFTQNRLIWDYAVTALSHEQFTRVVPHARRSVRGQLVHIMEVDDIWFRELQGAPFPEAFPDAAIDDRAAIRVHWDGVEQNMRAYLKQLRDDMIFHRPIEEPDEDRDLMVWQVLLHVINHGTDHRAQLLRSLNEMRFETQCQDYIFYAYDHPYRQGL